LAGFTNRPLGTTELSGPDQGSATFRTSGLSSGKDSRESLLNPLVTNKLLAERMNKRVRLFVFAALSY